MAVRKKPINADPPVGTWLPAPETDPKPDGPPWLPGSYQLIVERPEFRWPGVVRDEPSDEIPSPNLLGSLLEHVSSARASYLFLDEIVADEVSLVIHEWPVVDPQGRLWFDSDDDLPTIDIEVERFQAWLNQQRQRLADLDIIDGELATRRLAVGDCFAAVLVEGLRNERVYDGQVAALGGHRHVLEVTDSDRRRLLLVSSTVGGEPGALLDVTWDAQDASNAAYFAAATRPGTRRTRSVIDADVEDDEVELAAQAEAFGQVPEAAQDPYAVQDLNRRGQIA